MSNAGRYADVHRQQDEATAGVPEYPQNHYSGRGIVMLAGGEFYFTCAWICLWFLRQRLYCQLPVEVWYLGEHELSLEMRRLLERFDVRCIDASETISMNRCTVSAGWQAKIHAILSSSFREVAFIDADNLPLIDPALMFDWPAYVQSGALFWSDIRRNDPDSAIWELCRVPFVDGPEFESGQMVFDKQRSWKALQLVSHLNDRADIYYQHIHGDKDTFQLAWRMLAQPCGLIPHAPSVTHVEFDPGLSYPGNQLVTLLQYGPDRKPAFVHRSGPKLNAWGRVPPSALPDIDAEIRPALSRLRTLWSGRVGDRLRPCGPAGTRDELIAVRRFEYWRVGRDRKLIDLLPDGSIEGGGELEQTWLLEEIGNMPELLISGVFGGTCRLRYAADGVWRGAWIRDEQLPVEITPVGIARTTEGIGS